MLSWAVILVGKSERRLWGCVSSSLGLLNWLCYCRPVQGEGSARESGLWYRRYGAFDYDPPPRGWVFTAALSGEGDLALDPPSLCFSQRMPPPNHHYPFSLTRPSHSLLSEVIFSTIPFPLHPSVWPSRESLILSTLQICTLFRHGMPTPLQCLTLAPPPLLPTQTLMFIRRYSAHQLHPTLSGLFRSERTGVAYDSHTTE